MERKQLPVHRFRVEGNVVVATVSKELLLAVSMQPILQTGSFRKTSGQNLPALAQ